MNAETYPTEVTCDVSTTSLEETLPMLRSERPDATGYDRVCSVVAGREIQIRWLISNRGPEN